MCTHLGAFFPCFPLLNQPRGQTDSERFIATLQHFYGPIANPVATASTRRVINNRVPVGTFIGYKDVPYWARY